MKKPYKTIGILLAVGIVGIIAVRLATRGAGDVVESIADVQKRTGVPVRVETVQPAPFTRSVNFSGTLEGEEQAVVIARLMEIVREIPVRVGQRVARGELIARLDDANPQAMFRQAKSTRDDAKLDLDRMDTLYAQGAISRQLLDKARLAHNVAVSNFDAARDLIELSAPIAGEVVRIHLQAGEMAAPGQPVATIAASKQVRIRFQASADERKQLRRGLPARIYLVFSDTTAIEGVVEKVEDAADPKTRLFEITVRSENPAGLLKPGVLTSVDVIVEQRDGVLTVNREALLTGTQSPQVFVVTPDGRAQKRDVKLGAQSAARSEITAGLQPGDRVVVFGQNRLADGELVAIIEG